MSCTRGRASSRIDSLRPTETASIAPRTEGTAGPISASKKHGTPEKSKNDHNLEYQVDAFAKDLSNIFMDVVNSGKVNDFRDIFQTMDSDNSGTVSHSEFVTALEKFNFFLPNNDIR